MRNLFTNISFLRRLAPALFDAVGHCRRPRWCSYHDEGEPRDILRFHFPPWAFILKQHGVNKIKDDQHDHHPIHDQVYPNVGLVLLIKFFEAFKHFQN